MNEFYGLTIKEMQDQSWQGAEEKGFHIDQLNDRNGTLIRLCLIHSEVSEAVQEVKRHGLTEESKARLVDELSDVLIRCGDMAGCLGLDLEKAVRDKIAFNKTRPHRYGTPEVKK